MKKKHSSKHEDEVSKNEADAQQVKETTSVEGAPDESVKESDELEKLKSELNEKNDTLLRTLAEYQNYRKRAEKEKSDIRKHANEKLIMELLPVKDNFERAMSMIKDTADKNVCDGLEMIKKSIDEFFGKNGVEKVGAEGEPFDHNVHHAVMTSPVEDGVEADTITEVLQNGYTLNGKVIRPAMVKVSSH